MKRRGLTLVEVGVGLGLIAILMVPAGRMYLNAARANLASDQLTNALVLSQYVMESRVRVVAFASQVNAHGTDPGTGYTYDLAMTSLSARLKRADVTITIPGESKPLVRLSTLSALEN